MSRTILLVDDHAGFRRSARALLDAEGFTVIGEAGAGAAALSEVDRLRPDLVLLDIQLPDLDGFEVARRLAARPDGPRIILISSRSAAEYGGRVESARVQGFIPKSRLDGASIREVLG